jgi:hypothetical protein
MEYVPEGRGRLFAFAVLYRLFVTPTVIGSVLLMPLLVLLSMMTSVQPAPELLANATRFVAPAGHGPVVTRLKLLVTGPLLGSKDSVPRFVPGSSPPVAASAVRTPTAVRLTIRPAAAMATQLCLSLIVIMVRETFRDGAWRRRAARDRGPATPRIPGALGGPRRS